MANVAVSTIETIPERTADDAVSSAALDNQLAVTTPENIAFQYRMAGPFQRVGAYLLDILISQAAYAVLAALIMMLFSWILIPMSGGIGAGGLAETILGMMQGMVLIGMFLMTWFYGAVTEALFNGQTPGKKITSIRVLSTDGGAINGAQATLRNFFRLLDIMPMISLGFLIGEEFLNGVMLPTALFGLVVMSLNRGYRRIGDFVADTMVVHETRDWTHGITSFQDPRVAGLAEMIPADFEVSASLARALADYVDQRRFLAAERVAEIAAHLAPLLLRRFGLPADTNHDLLLCALYYRTFVDVPSGESENPFATFPSSVAVAAPTDASLSESEVVS